MRSTSKYYISAATAVGASSRARPRPHRDLAQLTAYLKSANLASYSTPTSPPRHFVHLLEPQIRPGRVLLQSTLFFQR